MRLREKDDSLSVVVASMIGEFIRNNAEEDLGREVEPLGVPLFFFFFFPLNFGCNI